MISIDGHIRSEHVAPPLHTSSIHIPFKILPDCEGMAAVRRWFAKFASQILAAVDPQDPNAARTAEAARGLIART